MKKKFLPVKIKFPADEKRSFWRRESLRPPLGVVWRRGSLRPPLGGFIFTGKIFYFIRTLFFFIRRAGGF